MPTVKFVDLGKQYLSIRKEILEKLSLEKQRKESVDKIDVNIVSVYDRVMGARGGLAVVQVEGSGCGGCAAHIPPQTLTEVRAKSAIHNCDMCGRVLYNEKISVN